MKEKQETPSKKISKDEFISQEDSKKEENKLSAKNLLWIGLGGIIGSSFFLASGLPISYAGPGVIFSYLLGGLL
ncbi:hypothetical protein GNF86_24830, partial [Clostridium perfringens]